MTRCDFSHRDLLLIGRIKVNVITTDSSSLAKFEVFGLLNQIAREVRRVERGSNKDIGVDNVFLKFTVRPLLVRSDDEVPSPLFTERLETQRVLGSTQKPGLLFRVLASVVKNC